MIITLINTQNIIFSVVFCFLFFISFLVLYASRLEECFKKGKVWQIRCAYFIISFIMAYICTSGLDYLINLII